MSDGGQSHAKGEPKAKVSWDLTQYGRQRIDFKKVIGEGSSRGGFLAAVSSPHEGKGAPKSHQSTKKVPKQGVGKTNYLRATGPGGIS